MFIGNTRILLKDDLARAMDAERLEKLKAWCMMLQAVVRAGFKSNVYNGMRAAATKTIPELRRVVAVASLLREEEMAVSEEAENSTRAFLLEGSGMVKQEEAERQIMYAEDNYAKNLAVQKMMNSIEERKAAEVQICKAAYDEYKRCITDFDVTWKGLTEADEAAAVTPAAVQARSKLPVKTTGKLPHRVKYKIKVGKQQNIAPGGLKKAKPFLVVTEM